MRKWCHLGKAFSPYCYESEVVVIAEAQYSSPSHLASCGICERACLAIRRGWKFIHEEKGSHFALNY